MSQVFDAEVGIIAEIERLALEARDIRRRIDHVHTPQDRRVLNRLLQEIEEQVTVLQDRLKR